MFTVNLALSYSSFVPSPCALSPLGFSSPALATYGSLCWRQINMYLFICILRIPSTELEAHALRHENISTFLSPYGARIVLGVGCSRALRQASAGPFLFLCSPVSLAMKLLSTLPEGRIRPHVITSHSQNFKTGRDHPAELPEPPGFLHEETETQR